MRFEFDAENNRDGKRKLTRATLINKKNDDRQQHRAIRWCRGRLWSVIFEIKRDSECEYDHLVMAWKATRQDEQCCAENI
jgi:hypothetical protein